MHNPGARRLRKQKQMHVNTSTYTTAGLWRKVGLDKAQLGQSPTITRTELVQLELKGGIAISYQLTQASK